jgi:hypothetical protein
MYDYLPCPYASGLELDDGFGREPNENLLLDERTGV